MRRDLDWQYPLLWFDFLCLLLKLGLWLYISASITRFYSPLLTFCTLLIFYWIDFFITCVYVCIYERSTFRFFLCQIPLLSVWNIARGWDWLARKPHVSELWLQTCTAIACSCIYLFSVCTLVAKPRHLECMLSFLPTVSSQFFITLQKFAELTYD